MNTKNCSQKLLQCYHCGNKTLMYNVGEHRVDWDEGQGYYGYFDYQMYECPVCHKITLVESYWDVAQIGFDEKSKSAVDYVTDTIIYPLNSFISKALPVEIQTAYDSALKVMRIDKNVCLIALRRTLELVCKDKNATGDSLRKKINSLAQNGVLPPSIKEACNKIRLYGNGGAHDCKEITANELNTINDFVRYVLEYIYILPQKISSLNKEATETTDVE